MRNKTIIPLKYNNVTEDDLLSKKGDTLLILWLAKNHLLNVVPKTAITKKVLLQVPNAPKHDKENGVIHYLAKTEEFKHIPKDILTEEILSTKGLHGKSVYHTLAEHSKIDLIPNRLLTYGALCLRSDTGWTPLHSIAHHTPHLIPKDIKLEDILLKTEKNITVLHTWASGSGWVDIPKEFITKKTLQVEDAAKQTPFSHMVNQFEYDSSYRKRFVGKSMVSQLKYVLSQASTKQLKEIVNNSEDYEKILPLIEEVLLKRKLIKELSSSAESIEV
jgi:hypothetical protein